MTQDPYAPYLQQADELFAQGQAIKAGQIWQAILKQQPAHQEARERLLRLKQYLLAQKEAEAARQAPQAPAPEPVPPPLPPAQVVESASAPPPAVEEVEPSPAPPSSQAPPSQAADPLDPDRLLAEGCTLYDMGQLQDSLRKWEQVLELHPTHALARSYANGVRRELGLPPLTEAVAPAAAQANLSLVEEDLDKLLREAVQLYDMGLTEDAISKWERVLTLDPQRREVETYLRDARRELEARPQAATAPSEPVADKGALELKLRQAEHLLSLQRHEEAAFTFQQALTLAPGHPAALAGLERSRKPAGSSSAIASASPGDPLQSPDTQSRIPMAIVIEGNLGGHEPQGVDLPASLKEGKAAPRPGLALPKGLHEVLERMPWLRDSKVLAGIGGGVLVLGVALVLLRGHLRDQELQRAVKAARATALAPLNKQTEIQDLSEPVSALRQEAEAVLESDPLRAYLRAETLVARAPQDAGAAQLLEKARAGLAGGVSGASLPEYERHLQNGDLEAATKVMDALLRSDPGNGDLKARAARLHLLLCAAHVGQGKWDAAEEDLARGRALFPDDKSWQAKLVLVKRVKAMPKNQQAGWLPLLG